MADLYYGVAGNPVSHSLSPVLMNIMVQHVNSHLKTKDTFKLHCTDLIEESLIQDALAWGYVKSTPKVVQLHTKRLNFSSSTITSLCL